jgi:hypothetical protein
MAEKIVEMGFQSTIADPDVWLQAASKGDSEQYFNYVLMYIDEILSMSCSTRSILEVIQKPFKLKQDCIEPPDYYLGAKLQEKLISGVTDGLSQVKIA